MLEIEIGSETVCREIYSKWFSFQHTQLPLLVNTTQSSPLSPIGIFLGQIFELHWTTGTNFASSPAHCLPLAFVLHLVFWLFNLVHLSIAKLIDTNMANVWR